MSADDDSNDALATGEIDQTDLRVLGLVADLYTAADPMPEGLVDRILFGVTLDALEAEVAQLQRLETGVSGARSEDISAEEDVKTITFTSRQLSVTVAVSPGGVDTVRIDGWASPGSGARIELKLTSGERAVIADEDGRFVFEDVPRGLAKFIIRPATTGSPVITPSLEL